MKEDDMKVMLKQPHAFTMAGYKFSIDEMRILMHIIRALQPKMELKRSPYKLRRDNTGHLDIEIPIKHLLLDRSKNHSRVKEALDRLTSKKITIKRYDEKGISSETFTNLIMAGECKYRSGNVELSLHKNLVPDMLGLAKGYTKYMLNIAFNSSSPNVMKLYQYVSHWRDKKQTFLRLDSLRKWLNIEHKYPRPAEIKKWILLPAMKELKEKADVWFDIAEVVKEGRQIIGWKFNIYNKKKTKQLKLPDHGHDLTEEEQKLLKTLQESLRLSLRQADILIKNAPLKDLRKEIYRIKLLILDKKLNNIGGFTVKVLSEKFNLKP